MWCYLDAAAAGAAGAAGGLRAVLSLAPGSLELGAWLQRVQGSLPVNPTDMPAVPEPPDFDLNTPLPE